MYIDLLISQIWSSDLRIWQIRKGKCRKIRGLQDLNPKNWEKLQVKNSFVTFSSLTHTKKPIWCSILCKCEKSATNPINKGNTALFLFFNFLVQNVKNVK